MVVASSLFRVFRWIYRGTVGEQSEQIFFHANNIAFFGKCCEGGGQCCSGKFVLLIKEKVSRYDDDDDFVAWQVSLNR